MDCSMIFPVHYQLPELAQTHVHWVSDAIQPSRPLSSSSPPTFSLSQYQSLFQWVSLLYQVAEVLGVSASASVLPMNIQGWFPLGLIDLISLQSKELSKVFSSTTVQKHQSFSAQPFYMVQISHLYITLAIPVFVSICITNSCVNHGSTPVKAHLVKYLSPKVSECLLLNTAEHSSLFSSWWERTTPRLGASASTSCYS